MLRRWPKESPMSRAPPGPGSSVVTSPARASSASPAPSSAPPPRRCDATVSRPGDHLYVTGVLGGPSAALRALERGEEVEPSHRERFARPRPRLAEALWLAQHGVHALIDTRRPRLRAAAPCRRQCARAAHRSGATLCYARLHARGRQGAAGRSTNSSSASPHALDADAFARTFALPLSEIGRVFPAEEGSVVARRGEGGARVDLGHGHDHFSS